MTARRLSRGWSLAAQLAVLLVGAALLAVAVRSACVDPGPPVSAPEPGTPRAGYCDAVGGSALWLVLVAAPLAVLACSAPAVRRRPALGWLAVAVLLVALWANAVYVGTLEFASTV
jgi:hypothetical protein